MKNEFRVWDRKKNVMMYYPENRTFTLNDMLNDDTLIFMQDTGIQDKNGKKIFAGDVLLGRFVLSDVEDYLWLQLTEKEKLEQAKTFYIEDALYLHTNPVPEDLEIKGNIFENPELNK
jgi:hypothetical protein